MGGQTCRLQPLDIVCSLAWSPAYREAPEYGYLTWLLIDIWPWPTLGTGDVTEDGCVGGCIVSLERGIEIHTVVLYFLYS